MDQKLFFRVTTEQYAQIAEAGKAVGLSPGQYAKHRALIDAQHHDLETKIDAATETTRAELQQAKSEIIKESRELVRTLSSYLITHLQT